ncbi:MAG: 4Fe-4S binding protein [Deltaproteobacteria bacterium]|nr:4Fe-4S binding protein [Deltaproteobacteria bacterium]
MNIRSLKLVYFSPTGTSRKIVEGIGRGIGAARTVRCDLTLPGGGAGHPAKMQEDLIVIGAPVYAGRIPGVAADRLLRLRGANKPAVVIVVYGNRAYEDALLELNGLARERGFMPVAAGAFIGEHSYSDAEKPIAVGRPDGEDLLAAENFGKTIRQRLDAIDRIDDLPALQVPGNIPLNDRMVLPAAPPVTREDLCTKCGNCVFLCPTAAIVLSERLTTDAQACIHCCACVKGCPEMARIMEDVSIRKIAQWLSTKFQQRKEPETFFSF